MDCSAGKVSWDWPGLPVATGGHTASPVQLSQVQEQSGVNTGVAQAQKGKLTTSLGEAAGLAVPAVAA